VQSLLRWNLGPMAAFTCVPSPGMTPIPCRSTGDVTTCPPENGGSACKESDIKKTVTPFKVCYQAGEGVRPGVDVELWQRTFGRPPEEKSCKVCFMLSVADKPFFIDFDSEFEFEGKRGIGTPFSGTEYEAAVGDTITIELLAAANNAGQVVDIALLAEPGAPRGSFLTKPRTVAYNKVTYNIAFLRHFIFMPTQGQEGTRYDVCFQGADANLMRSTKKCFSIKVLPARISWQATTPCPQPQINDAGNVYCPPDGHLLAVTVGCHYTFNLLASAPLYSLRLRQQQLPTCEGCPYVEGKGVRSCAALGAAAGKGEPCCGNGLCDGLETGGGCSGDCRADDESLEQTQFGTVVNDWHSSALYTYTPTRGAEGRRILKCFEGITNAGEEDPTAYTNAVVEMERRNETAPSFCLVLDVSRCSYCVPQAATLRSMSVHYFLNMDWLRIYNSNPAILDPDSLIQGADTLAVGPLYTAQRGDTLLSIAAMAKTTLKSILQVNSDLALMDGAELEAGQQICLLLCSTVPVGS